MCFSGIPHKKEYVIKNRDQQELWDGEKLAACGLENGETVFLCTRGVYLFNLIL